MTVENADVIDIIGIDNKTGNVVLTVSDHLDWSDSARHHSRTAAVWGFRTLGRQDTRDQPRRLNILVAASVNRSFLHEAKRISPWVRGIE